MKSTIKKYLSGRSSETEQNELLKWMRTDDHLTTFQSTKKEWKNEIAGQPVSADLQEPWKKIQDRLFGQMQTELQRTRRTLNFFKYAAILAVLISVPALTYFLMQNENPPALLIYTTVAAEYGQISKVVLPDSTVVWINSGSEVRYNNQFSENNRDIELIGEAFFKVSENTELPLIVHSQELRVKVLGTEFGVIAYPEESTVQVILEKGKVELTSNTHSSFRHEMKPGELANFNKEKKELTLSNVNTELFTSWKDGMINIYNLPLNELVLKLEKRYNQKFEVDNAIKNLPYTFTIKNENLNNILSLMEKITPVDVVQSGNVIKLKYNSKKVPKMN